jgi:hypothetical protein
MISGSGTPSWRAQRVLSSRIRVGFAYRSAEPLVWVPDLVAGAVGTARVGETQEYREPLLPLLTEYDVALC